MAASPINGLLISPSDGFLRTTSEFASIDARHSCCSRRIDSAMQVLVLTSTNDELLRDPGAHGNGRSGDGERQTSTRPGLASSGGKSRCAVGSPVVAKSALIPKSVASIMYDRRPEGKRFLRFPLFFSERRRRNPYHRLGSTNSLCALLWQLAVNMERGIPNRPPRFQNPARFAHRIDRSED